LDDGDHAAFGDSARAVGDAQGENSEVLAWLAEDYDDAGEFLQALACEDREVGGIGVGGSQWQKDLLEACLFKAFANDTLDLGCGSVEA
jgi:hypothetical protein